MNWLRTLPTTQLHAVVSILSFLGIVVGVMVFKSHPPDAFYVFVASYMGAAVTQYGVKRFTYKPDGTDVTGVS